MAPTQPRRTRSTRSGGFTLVELITVLVVVGIMAGVAAPRFFQRQGFDARAYTDQLRAMLRYGQKIAIAQSRNVFVRLNGNSVALCYDLACSLNARVTAPGGANSGSSVTLANCGGSGNWACEGVPNGLAVSSAAGFFFDPTGQPFAGTDAPQALNANFVALTVAVTGDGVTHNVTVTPVTGYVF